MIKELEINKDFIKKNWKKKSERKKIEEETLCTVSNFKNITCYFSQADLFINCFKGYEDIKKKLNLIDYGYGLTAESLEKYLNNKYGDSNSNLYFITVDIISFDYDKYYKNGSFIDLDGNNTNGDFYNMPDADDLEEKAEIENHWIRFSVFDITK